MKIKKILYLIIFLKASIIVSMSEEDRNGQRLIEAILDNNINLAEKLINEKTNLDAHWEEYGIFPGFTLTIIDCDWKEVVAPRNPSMITPLIAAINKNNLSIVELLLEAKVPLESRDRWGATALMRAFDQSNEKIIKLLIQKGANVNAIDKRDCGGRFTVLMHGILYRDCTEIMKKNIELLVDNGVDLDAQNDDGDTALIKIAKLESFWQYKRSTINKLIEAGANTNLTNNKVKTFLDYIEDENSKKEFINLINLRKQKIEEELFTYIPKRTSVDIISSYI